MNFIQFCNVLHGEEPYTTLAPPVSYTFQNLPNHERIGNVDGEPSHYHSLMTPEEMQTTARDEVTPISNKGLGPEMTDQEFRAHYGMK